MKTHQSDYEEERRKSTGREIDCQTEVKHVPQKEGGTGRAFTHAWAREHSHKSTRTQARDTHTIGLSAHDNEHKQTENCVGQ